MNVLLVAPCTDPNNPAQWPPIGLASIATALRDAGHTPHIADWPRMYKTTASFSRLVQELQPDVVGFTCFTMNVKHVAFLANIVRAFVPFAKIVIGGAHPSTLPDRVLSDIPDADFAVRGEGEVPMVALCDCLTHPERHALRNVAGLITRDGINSPYFHPNVDAYGIPAWDLINPADYDITTDPLGRAMPILTSRGCPCRCSFCAANCVSGPKWRRRSMRTVFNELRLLHDDYGIRRFITYDEGFGSHKSTMMEFCAELDKSPWLNDTKFDCGTGMRLDQIDEELLTTLKAHRFRPLIPFGIESGSDRLLKLMRKGTNQQLIREKITLLDKMGFHPCAYVILGYPTETREEMEATIRMTLELPFRQASYMCFMPLPGTEATEQLIESGELPKDFDYSKLVGGAIAYAPKGMTVAELQDIRRKAILRFFWRPRILWGMMTSWREIVSMVRRLWRIYGKDRTV